MSYLDSPRLHFTGWFQADVSTINNDIRLYQNASFVPEYQQLEQNLSWNPEGTGIFRFLDCSVTGAFLNGRQLAQSSDDSVIGMTIQNALDRAAGKLVDLDPQQQMVSQIWGMQVRVVDTAGNAMLQGEFRPAAFSNLWRRQQTGVRRDQQLAACYQSVLDDIQWSDTVDSPLLRALHAATEEDLLSIHFNLFGYGRNFTISRYTMGLVTGTIGPYRRAEPKHFVAGRQMIAVVSVENGFSASGGVGNVQGNLAADDSLLTLDMGNCFPLLEAGNELADIGKVFVGVLTNNPDTIQTTVEASRVVVIGEVPYLTDGWYAQTAGVQTIDLKDNPVALNLLGGHPLVLLTPMQNADGFKVFLQESIAGLYLRADSCVFRMDPGTSDQVKFHATRFGLPQPNAVINVSATDGGGLMGGTGAGPTISPPAHPSAAIPSVGTPAGAIGYPSTITTDEKGYATLEVSISSEGPGRPRGYISGQLYGIGYQLSAEPREYVRHPLDFVSVLAFSGKDAPENPTWYADIQPLFTQYANLYPIMGRHVVNLADYASVVSRINILQLAFSLPPLHPNHMPVTRDLGAGDRAIILKWLTTKGQDGLPPLGTPSESPAVSAPAVVDELATRALVDLLPEQGAGKTAVIIQAGERRKLARSEGEAK